MSSSTRIDRRSALGAFAALISLSSPAHAFGDAGAFNPRVLLTGTRRWDGSRRTGPGRWSWELARRTSAPARLTPTVVSAGDPKLLAEPFAFWAGSGDGPPLSEREVRGLERFLRLGGMLFVDDFEPDTGAFSRWARHELSRVLPESAPVKLDDNHVIYRTFYLLDRPVGRVVGPPYVDAIVRGRTAQVIFLHHDLMGALARGTDGGWAFESVGGGADQRELAARFAVNLAMYVLCSDYKDDQVHAPFLMRRRASRRE